MHGARLERSEVRASVGLAVTYGELDLAAEDPWEKLASLLF
jgi:hypothetical protein